MMAHRRFSAFASLAVLICVGCAAGFSWSIAACAAGQSGPELKVGDAAPDFNLSDQSGVMHRLSALRGKKVILAFYPADFTAG